MASSNASDFITGNFCAPILETQRGSFEPFTIVTTILPNVLATIVNWGCKKKSTQSYLEFLQQTCHPRKWAQHCNRWTEDDMNHKLSQTNCDTFDVTFLFKLIPEVCENADKLDLELRNITKLRNVDAHNQTCSATLTEIKTMIKESIELLLCKAGMLFEFDPQAKIEEFSNMIEDVSNSVRTKKEKSMISTSKLFCREGKKDIEDTVKKLATEKLPFSTLLISRRKVFHSLKLLVKDEQDSSNKLLVSCECLLDKFRGSCIIVTGDPGSGKSTLLRNLREDFMSTKEDEIFHGIKEFDLLIYLECRDLSVKSISDLIVKNFPKTMALIDDDQIAIDSIRELKLLICVDGIDELNQSTSELLNDIIDIFVAHGQSSFVLTSRPDACNIFQQNLNEKGLTSVTAHIQLLNEEREQLEFLNRYKENIPGINGDEMIQCFKRLDDSCKYNCMTHPVYLSIFSYIFHTDNEVVLKWKNEFDVMESLLVLSKKLIIERLIFECVEDHDVTTKETENTHLSMEWTSDTELTQELAEDPDLMMEVGKNSKMTMDEVDSLATKLLTALCDLSVRQLLDDKLVIDQRTYCELCFYTFGNLEVNYYTVLSCVLVGQEDQKFFEYLHKINAEFLAAKAILARLKNEPDAGLVATICRVVTEYTQSLQLNNDRSSILSMEDEEETTDIDLEHSFRFFNMFKLVVMGLDECGEAYKESLFRTTLEICRILVQNGPQLEPLLEFPGSCPISHEVAEATAKVIQEMAQESYRGSNRWSLTTPRQMVGSSRILSFYQPLTVTVDPPSDWVSPEALEAIVRGVAWRHTGNLNFMLEYSYTDLTPIDNFVLWLVDDSARCSLRHFDGCLSTEQGQNALVKAVLRPSQVIDDWTDRVVSLRIGLLEPRQHVLADLRKVDHHLDVRAQLTDGDRCRCPLPVGTKTSIGSQTPALEPCPPSLTVVCPSSGTDWKSVQDIIEDLAPEDNRFMCLRIQRWHGDDSALNQLVLSLLAAGVRTDGFGAPLWAPAKLDSHDRCSACLEATHCPGNGRCLDLLPLEQCSASSPDEMKAVTLVLTTLKQPSLRSSPIEAALRKLSILKLSIPRGLGTLPELLGPFLSSVAHCSIKNIHLILEHSYWDWYPVDEFLELLSSAEGHIVEFRGCISRSEAGCRALAALVGRKNPWDKVSLHIALMEPRLHPMEAFGRVPANTDVRYRVQLLDDATPCRRPLQYESDLSLPTLTIVCRPSAQPWQLVDTMIQNLAPKDKGYSALGLQGWMGTDESLELLLLSLKESGIWTGYDGGTRWKQATASLFSGRCEVCDQSHRQGADQEPHHATDETHHETGQETDLSQTGRCIKLLLPYWFTSNPPLRQTPPSLEVDALSLDDEEEDIFSQLEF